MKRITAAVLAIMLILCGCGQKSSSADNKVSNVESTAAETADSPNSNSYAEISDTDSESDTDTISENDTDTSTKKDSDTDKTKKDTNTDKNKSSDKDTDKAKSKTSSAASSKTSSTASASVNSQAYSYTVGGADDPIYNVNPENIQQFIIEEPVIFTDPEPDSTFVNNYENVDPSRKVEDSWFDDCVIMGDSLTVGLSLYNDAYTAFGNAKFVCASSLSYGNSQWAINAPNNVHPYYNGQKILLEDAAVVTGAKKAIITLGMNDIGIWGPEGSVENARSLIHKIRAKSPDLKIYLETVTPMIYGRQKARLNNALIRQFNANLQRLADEEGCGFLNSYDAFADSNGNLPYDLCSDPGGLGLHFNFKACGIWTEFLKSNVGNAYPYPDPEPESKPESAVDISTDTDLVNSSNTSEE